MSYVDRSDGGRWTIGGLAAATLGFGLAQFLGMSVIIPLIVAGAVFAVQTKLLDVHGPRAVVVAGLAGHTLWMLVGALFVEGGLAAVGWDVIIQLALICWLLAKPSTAAAIIAILFELAGSGLNLWLLTGAAADKALFVHLIIRIVVICAAVALIVENVRRPRSAESENERLAEIYR